MYLDVVRAYVLQHRIRRPNANGNVFLFGYNVCKAARIRDECRDLMSYRLNPTGRKSIRDNVEKLDGRWGVDGRVFLKGGVKGRMAAPFIGDK
jgi:hypothetical protein